MNNVREKDRKKRKDRREEETDAKIWFKNRDGIQRYEKKKTEMYKGN